MHVPNEDGPWGRPFWPNSPEGKAAVSISVALSIVKVWVEVKVLSFELTLTLPKFLVKVTRDWHLHAPTAS